MARWLYQKATPVRGEEGQNLTCCCTASFMNALWTLMVPICSNMFWCIQAETSSNCLEFLDIWCIYSYAMWCMCGKQIGSLWELKNNTLEVQALKAHTPQAACSSCKAMYPDFIESSPRGLVPSVSDCNGDKVWESLHVVQCPFEILEMCPLVLLSPTLCHTHRHWNLIPLPCTHSNTWWNNMKTYCIMF